jgi:hypothetical protein
MVEAKYHTSLYETVYREYRDAVYYSVPVWWLWPLEYAKYFLKKYGAPLGWLSLAIGFTLYGGVYGNVAAALLAGIGGNSFYDLVRERRWAPPELFKR